MTLGSAWWPAPVSVIAIRQSTAKAEKYFMASDGNLRRHGRDNTVSFDRADPTLCCPSELLVSPRRMQTGFSVELTWILEIPDVCAEIQC